MGKARQYSIRNLIVEFDLMNKRINWRRCAPRLHICSSLGFAA
jgi:hypothetical protein